MNKFLLNLGCAILLITLSHSAKAQLSLDQLKDKFKFFADVRTRAEYDFNYLNSSAVEVDERFRMRSRLRFGAIAEINKYYSIGLRIRTGNIKDQQSPHISWGSSGEDAPFSLGFDRAYIRGDYGKFWWWTGKNDFPFYTIDEFFWDYDVTPEGIAVGGNLKVSESVTIKPTGGFFYIQNAASGFLDDPSLAAAQLHLNAKIKKIDVNAAAGYFNFNDLPDLPDGVGTYAIDYSNIVGVLRIALKTKIPITVGANVMLNIQDYSNDSAIVVNNLQDEKKGFAGTFEVGALTDKGNWLAGYYYVHVEKYATVDYLSQDDWVRWGFTSNATGTRSSNLKGHEFRLGYAFGPKFNLLVRLFLVEGIIPNTPTTTIEKANRIRLDLNIGF